MRYDTSHLRESQSTNIKRRNNDTSKFFDTIMEYVLHVIPNRIPIPQLYDTNLTQLINLILIQHERDHQPDHDSLSEH